MKFLTGLLGTSLVTLAAAAATAPARTCGFQGRDIGQGTRLYLGVNERVYHVGLSFEISSANAQISPGIRLARPLWLYLRPLPAAGRPGELYLANIALQTAGGQPLFIRALRIGCGRGVSLFTDGAERYDQRRIHAAGGALTLPFLDAEAQRRCVAALLRANSVTLEFTPIGGGMPVSVRARLPLREKVALAGRLTRIELGRRREGRCEAIPDSADLSPGERE